MQLIYNNTAYPIQLFMYCGLILLTSLGVHYACEDIVATYNGLCFLNAYLILAHPLKELAILHV